MSYPPTSRITPDVQQLQPGEVFVFDSNLVGRHGRGAALTAKVKFGAVEGVGEGLTGRCYALPTVASPRRPLHCGLDDVRVVVSRFIDFAEDRPLFRRCVDLVNVALPRRFWLELGYSVKVAPL